MNNDPGREGEGAGFDHIDPERMRIFGLLPIAFLLVVLAPLGFLLVASYYRFGHQRDLIQALVFWLIWLLMLWMGVSGVLRWRRRPRGAEAVGRAEKVIADFRAAGPVRLRGDDMLLTLDPARNSAIFENFKFTTSFFPQGATARLEVGFEEFVDTRYVPGSRGGHSQLLITTTAGPTRITSAMAGFATVRDVIESLVVINMTKPVQFEANRRRVPKIVVPWYGWILVLGLLAALAAVIYALIRFVR